MAKKAATDLRAKTADELKSNLLDLKKEAFNLRFQRANGQLENTARVRQVRREIARIKTILGGRKCYLTFDIDGLDPAYAPGTGTPVWGGLTTAQAAIILRDIAGINVVGGDVVEVSPPFDHANMTAVAGAHVAYELICLWAWNRPK